MYKVLSIWGLALCLVFTSCSSERKIDESTSPLVVGSAGHLTRIEIGDLFAMKSSGGVYLIDCRPSLFYRIGHIEEAINIPYKQFDKKWPTRKIELDKAIRSGQVIVCYCQNTKCPDAYKTAQKLAALGYSASIYHGGWEEWKRAGL